MPADAFTESIDVAIRRLVADLYDMGRESAQAAEAELYDCEDSDTHLEPAHVLRNHGENWLKAFLKQVREQRRFSTLLAIAHEHQDIIDDDPEGWMSEVAYYTLKDALNTAVPLFLWNAIGSKSPPTIYKRLSDGERELISEWLRETFLEGCGLEFEQLINQAILDRLAGCCGVSSSILAGEEVYREYEELRYLRNYARNKGRPVSELELRQRFMATHNIWADIDAAQNLSPGVRQAFFETLPAAKADDLFTFIGHLHETNGGPASAAVVKRWWKEYRRHSGKGRKRRSRSEITATAAPPP